MQKQTLTSIHNPITRYLIPTNPLTKTNNPNKDPITIQQGP